MTSISVARVGRGIQYGPLYTTVLTIIGACYLAKVTSENLFGQVTFFSNSTFFF